LALKSAVCCLRPFLVPMWLIVSPLAGGVTSGGNFYLMRLSDFFAQYFSATIADIPTDSFSD